MRIIVNEISNRTTTNLNFQNEKKMIIRNYFSTPFSKSCSRVNNLHMCHIAYTYCNVLNMHKLLTRLHYTHNVQALHL